jgi:hypothetical protein
MINQKINNIVEGILQESELARNSDKHLQVMTLKALGHKVYISNFNDLPSGIFETIRRTRQKIQEQNENLRSSSEVQEYRKERQVLVRQEMCKKEDIVIIPNHLPARQVISVENNPTRRILNG